MEQTVFAIKSKRKQCHELQQEVEQLEKVCTEQVLADTLAALKREVPLLESIDVAVSVHGNLYKWREDA